ncbi:MAG: hypothetical protein WC661_12305 [Opitutaceae bacterium]|jgi:hypothetical protein
MKPLIDLEIVVTAMSAEGFSLVRTEEASMDSGVLEFSNGKRKIVVWKERSIWEISALKEELVPLGLWKGFSDTHEFCEILRAYAKNGA